LREEVPPFRHSQAATRYIETNGFSHFALSNLVAIVKIPQSQVLPAAQASVVGILEDPRFCSSFRGVKLSGLSEDLKKDILHQILCLARIAKDSQSNFQDKPVIPLK
jgi:hypothetical protein